ncbi:ABC transporter ATP-binding protein [Solwaraspora sp. WMMD1047]|uniref:ABC transporter transmembrane domain-containing protein n=1 Tax=Solwaraspora sp. WMMD1047 TaxID=3016102 RepID=UPI002415CD3C|nr:ABC transporter ATP-binding protein [Solwaraspora sp. WMMD1047]MDG4829283.1 ABC transporter ATP-binding protein [Solwaraspora sp. WMMD1047]
MRELPEPVGDPDTRSATRFMLWLARGQARGLLAATVFGVTTMVATALVPAAIGRAIDSGLDARDPGALMAWTGVVLALGAVQTTTAMLRHRAVARNYLAGAFATVTLTVRKIVQLGNTLPKRLASGEVLSIGVSDADRIGDAMVITGRGVGALAGLVVAGSLLISTIPEAGWVAVAAVPFAAFGIGRLLRPLHSRQQDQRTEQAGLATRASDIIAGLRALRGIGGEDVFLDRYRAQSQATMRAGIRVAMVDALLVGYKALLPGLLVALVVWVGARRAISGAITPGELVAAYGYTAYLLSPFGTLTAMAGKWAKAHVAAERLVRLLNIEPEITDVAGAGQVQLRGRSPQQVVDVESGLTLAPGTFTAVTATDPGDAIAIAHRIGRLSDDGRVLYGEQKLTDLPLDVLRKTIIVATPEDRLFSGTLREQLDPHAGRRQTAGRSRDAAITDAIDVAAAANIVDDLPAGLDSYLHAAGQELSGGQLQRLLLARALITEVPVLVLVEPTTAVDAHTEAEIASRLGPARAGKTTMVVTSSPIVLARADRVVMVCAGRVAAEGTHTELLSTHPEYARTVARDGQ